MNLLPLILPPAFGFVIGFVTNAVAIRMMFRPYEEVRFLGLRFQGMIPRRKADIARNISHTVVSELLREESVADRIAGADVGVGYFVDGQYVGWGIRGPMAAGETSSNFGMAQRWTAAGGTHQITAVVDDIDRFTESDENNNSHTENINVSGGSTTIDLLPYLVPQNSNFRVYSRLRKPDGGTADEEFAYRDGSWSNGLRRWFFVKNASGENWEEFAYDGTYIYRNRDTSWANTCQDGAAAYYQVTDQDRAAFARWIKRYMKVG